MSKAAWLVWLKRASLAALLLLAFGVRLYRLDDPLADWHSFRQADTASVTREYVKNGVDLLRPRYHDISNIQSGEFNPEGWRMVELPLVNGILAWILRANPAWNLVIVSRLASILATVTSIAILWWLVVKQDHPVVAWMAALVWTLMPYAIFYGRVILPEPFMLFAVLLTSLFLQLWLDRQRWWWLPLAGLSGAVALLLKPVAIFFALWWLGMIIQKRPAWLLDWKRWLLMASTALLAVLPLIWWRNWIQNFPTGIPAATWLLNGNGIRFRPAWWRWIFADRIGRLMFGYWGASLLAFGLVATFPAWTSKMQQVKKMRQKLWQYCLACLSSQASILGLTIGLFLYLSIFATGNVQHDYYQVLLIPLLAWLWAKGSWWIIQQASAGPQRLASVAMLIVIAGFSWFFSWYAVKDWFEIQNPAIVKAGQAVQQYTKPDDLIIAPYMGDTAFLFQTNRRGWPLGFWIEERIAKGAKYYVSTAYDDEANELMKRYQVVVRDPDFVLINLTEPVSME